MPREQMIVPLAFHEASLVPEGDNPEAAVVLTKEKPMPKDPKQAGKENPADPMASFSDEQKAAVSALMADAQRKAVDDYKAAEAKKAAEAAAQEDEMPEEKPEEGKAAAKAKAQAEAAAKAQAELSAKVAAQEKELAEYKAKLAEERDARLTREYAAEAAKFRTLPDADVAKVLREVDEKCSKEVGKALRSVLTTADERAKLGVDVAAARYGRGDDTAPESDPDRQLEQAAKALREKDPKLDAAEAYRLALRQNPKAYAASKARSQAAARE